MVFQVGMFQLMEVVMGWVSKSVLKHQTPCQNSTVKSFIYFYIVKATSRPNEWRKILSFRRNIRFSEIKNVVIAIWFRAMLVGKLWYHSIFSFSCDSNKLRNWDLCSLFWEQVVLKNSKPMHTGDCKEMCWKIAYGVRNWLDSES